FRFNVMWRLLRASSGIPAPRGSFGAAIVITSAPRSPSIIAQNGPGSWRERSSTRRSASAVVTAGSRLRPDEARGREWGEVIRCLPAEYQIGDGACGRGREQDAVPIVAARV